MTHLTDGLSVKGRWIWPSSNPFFLKSYISICYRTNLHQERNRPNSHRLNFSLRNSRDTMSAFHELDEPSLRLVWVHINIVLIMIFENDIKKIYLHFSYRRVTRSKNNNLWKRCTKSKSSQKILFFYNSELYLPTLTLMYPTYFIGNNTLLLFIIT